MCSILCNKRISIKGVVIKRLFCSNGIRGEINRDIDASLAYELGRAMCLMFRKKKVKVVVGKDTNNSSNILEKALVAGINSVGADAFLIGVVPIGVVPFAIKQLKSDVGVMISGCDCKHNICGFKFFNGNGYTIAEEQEAFINNAIEYNYEMDNFLTNDVGKCFVKRCVINQYINYICCNFQNIDFKDKICVDCGNGAVTKILEKILIKLQINFKLIGKQKNYKKINHSGYKNLSLLQKQMESEEYIYGFALDGDGCRIKIVDKNTDEINENILSYFLSKKANKIVENHYCNLAVSKSINEKDTVCYQTEKYGEKHIVELMLKTYSQFGNNGNGEYIFADVSTTTDAIVTLLKFIKYLSEDKNSLCKCKKLELIPYVQSDVEIDDKQKIIDNDKLKQVINICESLLLENGRVAVKINDDNKSVNIFAEGMDKNLVELIVNTISNEIKNVQKK